MTLSKLSLLTVLSFLAAQAVCAAPAQSSAPGCSVTIADHALISGTDAVVGTDIFNGELLQTRDNGDLMVQCKTVKLAMASNSSIRVFQSGTRTSVELERGIVAYSTAGQSEDLALYSLDVKVVPDTRQTSAGQLDVSSHCELSVRSTKSSAAVTTDKETKIVEESKAYDVTPKLGVDYSDDWHPVPADYPDFPREAKYHDSHRHVACAAAALEQNAATAKAALTAGEFHQIIVTGALVGTGITIWGVLRESPSKPSSADAR